MGRRLARPAARGRGKPAWVLGSPGKMLAKRNISSPIASANALTPKPPTLDQSARSAENLPGRAEARAQTTRLSRRRLRRVSNAAGVATLVKMLTDRKGALLTSNLMISSRRRTAASPRSLAPPRRALLWPCPPALRSPKRSLLEISAARLGRKRGFNLRAGQRLQGSDQKEASDVTPRRGKNAAEQNGLRAPGPQLLNILRRRAARACNPSQQVRLQRQIFPARGHGKEDVSRALACRTPA